MPTRLRDCHSAPSAPPLYHSVRVSGTLFTALCLPHANTAFFFFRRLSEELSEDSYAKSKEMPSKRRKEQQHSGDNLQSSSL